MSFAADPVYNKILDTYFGDTPTIGQEVWNRYVQYINPALQSNPTFDQFLENYAGLQSGTIQTMSSVTALPTGPYTTYLSAYVKNRTPAEQLDIWRAFLSSQGYSAAPSATDINSTSLQDAFGNFVYGISNIQNSIIQSLQQFASQYNALGFSNQTLQLNQVTTIPQGFYSNYLSAFFGGDSQIEQLDIWRSFLVSIGYPQPDPQTGQTIYNPSPEDLASPTMEAAFVRQMGSIRSQLAVYSAETSESPQQVACNTVLDSVMSSLANMLNVTETLVRNQANTLMYTGEVQQQYSSMLNRVPTLTPGDPQTIVVPDLTQSGWALSKFVIGYDNISLQDVADWAAQTALNSPGTAATLTLAPLPVDTTTTTATTTTTTPSPPQRTMNIAFSVVIPPGSNQGTVTFNLGTNPPYSATFSTIDSKGLPVATSTLYTNVENALKSIITTNATIVTSTLQNQNVLGIPGRFLASQGDTEGDSNEVAQAALDSRNEQNAILQQYVENIRALRDAAQTLSQNEQNAAEATKNNINDQTSVWTNILEMISDVVKSIFK